MNKFENHPLSELMNFSFSREDSATARPREQIGCHSFRRFSKLYRRFIALEYFSAIDL